MFVDECKLMLLFMNLDYPWTHGSYTPWYLEVAQLYTNWHRIWDV